MRKIRKNKQNRLKKKYYATPASKFIKQEDDNYAQTKGKIKPDAPDVKWHEEVGDSPKEVVRQLEKVNKKIPPPTKFKKIPLEEQDFSLTPKGEKFIKALEAEDFKKVDKIAETDANELTAEEQFERDFPGKHAIWGGKETKAFIAWKDEHAN